MGRSDTEKSRLKSCFRIIYHFVFIILLVWFLVVYHDDIVSWAKKNYPVVKDFVADLWDKIGPQSAELKSRILVKLIHYLPSGELTIKVDDREVEPIHLSAEKHRLPNEAFRKVRERPFKYRKQVVDVPFALMPGTHEINIGVSCEEEDFMSLKSVSERFDGDSQRTLMVTIDRDTDELNLEWEE